MTANGEPELALFSSCVERDKERYIDEPALLSWLFVDRLRARNERTEMNFYGFEGDAHLSKFFNWQKKLNIKDYLPSSLVYPLADASLKRDRSCLARLNLAVPHNIVSSLARYNAQDYLFQRFYPVPEMLRPKVVLDFGAGYGRNANLAFGAPEGEISTMISVDAIPGPYLTQRVYYRGLEIKFADYIDFEPEDFDFVQRAASNQLIHLPTWRLDLIPSNHVDMVCCVQVLKELPGEVLIFALRHFARILKPRGSIYIRDHLQFHHPNQMPVEKLLLAMGFVLEFEPVLRDREETHGVPRIWRKLDSSVYLNAGVKQGEIS